ncbi:MAG: glycosyltransferase family 4 protein [Elusimicrobiota bacterium]
MERQSNEVRGMPALISSSRASHWVSNRAISSNLQEAYRRLWAGDDCRYSLPQDHDTAGIAATARALSARLPNRIVFVDHHPHPAALLAELAGRLRGRRFPPLYFHLYGDFTLHLKKWRGLEPLLQEEKCSVAWICASDRQAALVRRLLPLGATGVCKCPFPVDPAAFSFDGALRARVRADLGFREDDRVLIYTGRISLQKNSIRVLREVSRFIRTAPFPVRLLLAGSFDDIGAPFFGVNHLPGYYFQLWRRTLESLPSDVRARISHVGNVNSRRLAELYHASDCYLSLSLHHDEDFGMAPAEALSCGNTAVLTDWGGYSSFQNAPGCCRLVSVSLGPRGLRFSSGAVQRALLASCRQDSRDAARESRGRRFLSFFSIEKASSDLSRIHEGAPPRFRGFNPLLERLCSRSEGRALFPAGPGKDPLYHKLYRHYFSGSRN